MRKGRIVVQGENGWTVVRSNGPVDRSNTAVGAERLRRHRRRQAVMHRFATPLIVFAGAVAGILGGIVWASRRASA